MRPLFIPALFDGHQWLQNVRIEWDATGTLTAVTPASDPDGCRTIEGCIVPGIPNLHSHAHQRAMAGLAESQGGRGREEKDSFWSWRTRMYGHLETMTPDDLEASAAQLYVEMVEAGYTAVGEFQYLHHQGDGTPYADPAEMTLRCLAAAREVGIGFTALPVFYAHGGFGGEAPTPGQRRFLHTVDAFLRLVERLEAEISAAEGSVGIAPHSLRAVAPEELVALVAAFHGRGPIHLHIAEQLKEVDGCLAWCSQRPVEWLLEHFEVDESWCLIHCTHLLDGEVRALAATGAVAGLCPTTEANLGDGIFRAADFLSAGGRIGIGSDSHISISPVEELRWLEYGQRLTTHQRNVLSRKDGTDTEPAHSSTGRRLLEAVLAGGAQACGRNLGALQPGARADFVVLDTDHPLLAERQGDEILDSWIFSGNRNLVQEVWIGGQPIVQAGRHPRRDVIAARFRTTQQRLRRRTA